MKRRLSPLKKPQNYSDIVTQDQTIISSLNELIQLQRKTVSILENNPLLRQHSLGPKKFIETFDTIKIEKPMVSFQGDIQREQELRFDEHHENLQEFKVASQKNLNQVLTKKSPTIQNKKYNVLNDFIPYTDRRQYKILISFASFAKNIPLIRGIEALQIITIEWIGDVFRMVASMCWNMMLNGFLNFEETKILFTENIIYNYIEFMKELDTRGFSQHKHRLTSVINKKSVNILEFLGKQYPQTKIEAPNIRLRQILPNTNNSSRMKFDVIMIASKKGLEIKCRENANYAVDVMSLINFMIDEINDIYPDYEKDCLKIFEQVFKRPEKRIKSAADDKNLIKSVNQIEVESTEDIIYKQKVKKYTKFIIGRKINKNVPKYTREQVNSGIFYPKSPSILRIITKWVEELTDIIKHPTEYILSANNQLKSHDGGTVILFAKTRNAICQKIIEKRKALFDKVDAINEECFRIQSMLCAKEFTTDQTQSHLSDDQIAVGKFSVSVQRAISTYVFQELNQILHFLLKIPSEVDVNQLGLTQDFHQTVVKRQLDRLNLVTMKVFDLLRCKCISNQEQIMWIMNYLIEKNDLGGDIKLVRVKDRLNLGTRDVNCNVRFKKNGLISEMQLSVASNINIETKQQKLDSYNHFLYELKRSKLGPLSENVSIWTVLEQRSQYFQQVSKKPAPENLKFHSCSNENIEIFIRPICCEGCKNFFPYPEIVYSNVKCKKCQSTYCGECYSKFLNEDDRKQIIFHGLFKLNTLNHIKQHTKASDPFPTEGIYFKRYHERRQINFFTVLMQNASTKQFITFESIKQQNKKQVNCIINFTHNAIRNNKTVEKQKNIDHVIRAVIRNQNQLYIHEKDYEFFGKYLVFYFDPKFKPTLMTMDQMQSFLTLEQNHGLKIVNIMEDPVYVDEVKYLKKKAQKIKELHRLKQMFESIPNQQFLTYHFAKIFIVAKAYKDSMELGNSINYANNLAEIKSVAIAQKSIMSMESCKMKDEFKNITISINPKIVQKLYKSLRKLYLNSNRIQTLDGLKQFVFLQVLYIRYNRLISIQGVQGMKYLIVFNVDHNQITDLSPLKPLVGLKRFMAIYNKVTSVEPLSSLTELRTLELQYNLVEDIKHIKDLQRLEQINLQSNPKICTLPLFASKTIKFLALSQTSITDISSLQKYPQIRQLMLKGLHLKEIPQFIKKMRLTELWLNENQIEQLTNLEGQNELETLSLRNNKLKNIQGIGHLIQISTIYLDNNQITSLEGIKPCFDTLKHLSLKSNPLNDVKPIMFADESLKFEYTKESISEKAQQFLDQYYLSKVNSSGSED